MLLEATNLLIIPGRKVAPAGDKSENPNIEYESAVDAKTILILTTNGELLKYLERPR